MAVTDTDIKFLHTATEIARIWSKDPSTKVAAVAVGEQRNQIAWGYNGFPPGIADTPARLAHRETKLSLTLPAEQNALANAEFPARTLYVTHHPCGNCALHILAARTVSRVFYLHDAEFEARWFEMARYAKTIFSEAGIQLIPVVLAP